MKVSQALFGHRKNIVYLELIFLIVSIAILIFFSDRIVDSHSKEKTVKRPQTFTLPEFRLPYDEEQVDVQWTGGPHKYGLLDPLATFSPGHGSGLDFASGSHFEVLAMASGKIIEATCEGYGLFGCIVAIRHDVGGTVLIYAHLEPSSSQYIRQLFTHARQAGTSLWVSQGVILGKAGQSGGQDDIHLHIELRDGADSCDDSVYDDCLPNDLGGEPIGWEDLVDLDGYQISGYFDVNEDLEPIGVYNYDGSAVKGDPEPYYNFPYLDWPENETKFVAASVDSSFHCDSNTDCEVSGDPSAYLTTQFAGNGSFGGGATGSNLQSPSSPNSMPAGGQLISTNTADPLSPPPASPNDGATFVADITIPDGTVVSLGQALVKTWRLRNTGTSTWGGGYQLVFVDGEQMGAPSAVNVPTTAPGQEVDISVNLTAPNSGGDHTGYWQLRNAQGTYFGPTIWVELMVSEDDPPSNNDFHLVCLDCPATVPPNHSFRPTIRATVNSGQLLQSRGDMLRNVDGNLYGAFPHIAVVGSVNEGQTYDFTFYADDPITAPATNGTYQTKWRIWRDGDWAGPELTIVFEVQSGGGGTNYPPNPPSLISPHDWYVYYSGNTAQLCAQANGDPDGDAVTHYYFEIYESAQLWNSGWVSSNCVTTSTLGPYGYQWRVKVRDSDGAESDWSDTWHFTLVNPNLEITELYFEPLDSESEIVRVRACTSGQGGVGITMRVSVNDANDGSDTGEWHILKELGVPCFNEIDAPTWNTLEYGGGPHRVRVEAHGSDTGWDGAAVRDEIFTVPSNHRPNSPYEQYPRNGAYIPAQTVMLDWIDTLRTTQYQLIAATAPDFNPGSQLLNVQLPVGTSQYTHAFANDYSNVHWKVIATGPYGTNEAISQFHIDVDPPDSSVASLPHVTTDTVFSVGWGGSDVRSGLRWYHVQFREGDRPDSQWVDWLVDTDKIAELFQGQPGHTYYFRARAMDEAGNWEAWPGGDGDTFTLVDPTGTGTADLALLDLRTYPNASGDILVEALVQNLGDLETGNNFYTDIYLDHVPDGPGDYSGSVRFWVNDSIAPGTTLTLTTIITDLFDLDALAPESIAPGAETSGMLYSQVDSTGVVAETDSNNNIHTDGVEVCVASADAYEADDTRQSATPLGFDTSQTHNVHALDDQDWFSIQLLTGENYVIQTSDLGTNADTYLYLYDTDGTTLLVANDDTGGALASKIVWTAPANGTYYLLVKHWNPNVGGCGTSYTIALGETVGNLIHLPAVLNMAETVDEPDQIAFASDSDGDFEIYLMNIDGSGLTQLTNNDARDEAPSWSPDGSQLVFHSDRDGYQQIYKMNADGSGQTRLLASPYWDEWPFWSPDGDKIIFGRVTDHNADGMIRTEVFIMNADGTNVSHLTFSTGQTGAFAHGAWSSGWSPDSSQILFYRYLDGYDQLWIMDSDGSNQQKLTEDNHWNAVPTMSPDGTKIAFASFRDGNYEIYLMNADGSDQVRLTNEPTEDWHPRWSQSGHKLLFETKRNGNIQVYWMNVDGSGQERLTNGTTYAGQPDWRP